MLWKMAAMLVNVETATGQVPCHSDKQMAHYCKNTWGIGGHRGGGRERVCGGGRGRTMRVEWVGGGGGEG